MLRSIKVSLWAVAALVAGCGGGGGSAGSPAPAPATSFDVNAAWRNLLTSTGTTTSWAVSGTANNGKTYGITISTTPRATDVFPITGTSFNATDVTALLTIGGLGISTSTSRNYYNASYELIGTRNTVDVNPATCSVAVATVTPPTAASVGSSGAMQTFTDYSACTSSSAQEGTSVTTWSLEADGSLTLFCLNTTVRNTSNTVLTTEGDCIEVAQNGTLGTHARVTLTEPPSGLTLVAKNY